MKNAFYFLQLHLTKVLTLFFKIAHLPDIKAWWQVKETVMYGSISPLNLQKGLLMEGM